MNAISRFLWIGDLTDGANVVELKRAGITAVVNVTPQPLPWSGPQVELRSSPAQPPKIPFAYLQLNQNDGAPIPLSTLAAYIGVMQVWMAGRQRVLIHCGAGISRAAAFMIGWLAWGGFEWDAAEEIVRRARPIIAPAPQLKESWLRFLDRWPPSDLLRP